MTSVATNSPFASVAPRAKRKSPALKSESLAASPLRLNCVVSVTTIVDVLPSRRETVIVRSAIDVTRPPARSPRFPRSPRIPGPGPCPGPSCARTACPTPTATSPASAAIVTSLKNPDILRSPLDCSDEALSPVVPRTGVALRSQGETPRRAEEFQEISWRGTAHPLATASGTGSYRARRVLLIAATGSERGRAGTCSVRGTSQTACRQACLSDWIVRGALRTTQYRSR